MDSFLQGNGPYPLKTTEGSLLSSIGSVGSVRSLKDGGGVAGPLPKDRPGISFKDTVVAYLDKVNGLQGTAEDYARRLAAGEEIDMHKVMIAGEQASMALSMTIQMRNRAVEAYQEILRMQV